MEKNLLGIAGDYIFTYRTDGQKGRVHMGPGSR